MAPRVTADGDRAVVVKRATAANVDRLRLEGERLQRASHPGVVQVVSSARVGDGWELRTAHVGRPLSILERPSVPQAAAVIAAVAATLADLHRLGLVHGRLDASHVLVCDHGRPVLCGFGDGSAAAGPEDDVAALGALLADLVGGDHELEPIPERRWRGRQRWSGWDRRALLLLADQACAEPATRRPTARRLAASISDAVPDLVRLAPPHGRPVDEHTGGSDGDETDPIERLRASALVDTERRTVRPRTIALAVAGAGLLVAGVMWLGSEGPPNAAAPAIDVEPSPTSSTAGEQHTATAVEDSVLTVGGRRYRVGQAGDEVLVEDWDCDGTSTPALLRPGTGEVFIFPRWIERAELAIEPVLQVAGADALVSEVTPSGCPTLAVRTPSGDLVPVVAAPSR